MPAAGAWILRDLVVCNLAATPANVTIWIRQGAGTKYVLSSWSALAPAASTRLELRQELENNEILSMGLSQQPISLLATGYQFTA